MVDISFPAQAAEVIQKKSPGFSAKVGIILGSGLGKLADEIRDSISIPYAELPGFNHCTVAGHQGFLHLGWIHDVPVACLQGRAHYYEGTEPQVFHNLIRTLKLIGCDTLINTNAAGSLREEVGPGNIVMLTDHINLQTFHPLVGKNDDEFGPRFFGMDDAYDPILREALQATANQLELPLEEGVYVAVNGPSFETPAEIRAFRILGADVVGMSTVPEVLVARHCGLRVAAIAAITNYAAGMRQESLSHEITLSGAKLAADKLFRLITGFLENMTK